MLLPATVAQYVIISCSSEIVLFVQAEDGGDQYGEGASQVYGGDDEAPSEVNITGKYLALLVEHYRRGTFSLIKLNCRGFLSWVVSSRGQLNRLL